MTNKIIKSLKKSDRFRDIKLTSWLESLCEIDSSSVFCNSKNGLIFLSKNLPNNYNYNDFIRDIKVIYDELKPSGNNNMVIFRGLMENIVNLDTPINSIKIISEYIKKSDDNQNIKLALKKFKDSDWSPTNLDDFIKRTKNQTYNEYEDYFVGPHFESHRTKLILNFKKNEEEGNNIDTINKVLKENKNNTSKIAKNLHQNIINNFIDNMVKSDLKCLENLKDESGKIIIKKGDFIEVKKIDYEADSYLSEFFSIYKSSLEKLPEYARKQNFRDSYNQLIDSVYKLLLKDDGGIIDSIKKSFTGIIYDENVFIHKDNIELYWSNKGRSSCDSDHRLSIRYRVKKSNENSVHGYVYSKTKGLKKISLVIPNHSKNKIYCNRR
jgi:hypothetical protein